MASVAPYPHPVWVFWGPPPQLPSSRSVPIFAFAFRPPPPPPPPRRIAPRAAPRCAVAIEEVPGTGRVRLTLTSDEGTCCLCLETCGPSPRWYAAMNEACERAHFACSECISRVPSCPFCRGAKVQAA